MELPYGRWRILRPGVAPLLLSVCALTSCCIVTAESRSGTLRLEAAGPKRWGKRRDAASTLSAELGVDVLAS